MKCITVKPVWADLIAVGIKTVENRSWRTRHRGPLLIHAAKPTGAIVALVDLVDCVPVKDAPPGPFTKGPWCWVLANVRRLNPVAWRGRQKLFDVPWPQSETQPDPASP